MTYKEAKALRTRQLAGEQFPPSVLAQAIAVIQQPTARAVPPAPPPISKRRSRFRPEDTVIVKRLRAMLRRSGG